MGEKLNPVRQIMDTLRPIRLLEGHPLVSDSGYRGEPTLCAACRERFQPGQYLALVPLGPGKDPEERERAWHGMAYNAVAVPVHWPCATGVETP